MIAGSSKGQDGASLTISARPALLARLTGAALAVVTKEWPTTPDRCARPTRDRRSSTPVPAAGVHPSLPPSLSQSAAPLMSSWY